MTDQPSPPSKDLDGLSDKQIVDLAIKVEEAWADRDAAIKSAQTLFKQAWDVTVPEAWRQKARTAHTALAKEIPLRVINTVTLRDLQFSRMNPGDDFGEGSHASAVERYFQGYFHYNRRTGLPGRDAYKWSAGQFVHKGASCVGSLFAPREWATAPLFLDGEKPRLTWWRDSAGRETDDEQAMDLEATGRAYLKAVDGKRMTAKPPISRRYLPTEQCYPLFVEGELVMLVIKRQSTLLELNAAGYAVETGGEQSNGWMSGTTIREIVTPNRCRYYRDFQPITYQGKTEGLVTNYGFVPYSYRVGLDTGDTDWGSVGLPLLGLIESQLKTITILRTYLEQAVHLASFTTFQLRDLGNGQQEGRFLDNRTGKELTTFKFKSGTIIQPPEGKEIAPLTHPGLNADFWKLVQQETDEINRIVPRTLSGQPTSSGYETAQVTTNAKAIFDPLFDGLAMQEEELAVMDMHHIAERVPGPIYLEYEQPRAMGSSRKKELSLVRLSKTDIKDYYQIRVTADKEVDRITLGTWAKTMASGEDGVGDIAWVADMAGIPDYEDMELRRARDRVLRSERMMAVLEEDAINAFGLRQRLLRAEAAKAMMLGPDGVPLVMLPDGRGATPGRPMLPAAQGATGAAQGPANRVASVGQPNLDSTNNPSIGQPGRSGRDRARRRGGAIPGAPQRQPARPAAPVPV